MDPRKINELEMNIDVASSLLVDLDDKNDHILEVLETLVAKIADDSSLPDGLRENAQDAIASLKAINNGELTFKQGYVDLTAAIDALARELLSLKSQGMPQETATSTVEASQTHETFGSKEPESLDAQIKLVQKLGDLIAEVKRGKKEAIPAILEGIRDIGKSTESWGERIIDIFGRVSGKMKTYASKIRTFLESSTAEIGENILGVLTNFIKALSEYFNFVQNARKKLVSLEQAVDLAIDDLDKIESRNLQRKGYQEDHPISGLEAQRGLQTRKSSFSTANLNSAEIRDFVSEAEDWLASAEVAMMELEKDPSDKEAVNEVFRCFHNIKGAAGFLGLWDFEELSHNAESLLEDVRSGQLEFSGPISQTAFSALDMLKEMFATLKTARPSGGEYPLPRGYHEMIARLKNPLGGIGHRQQGGSSPQNATTSTTADGATLNEQMSRMAAVLEGVKAKSEDYIKVRTTRLDNLVDAVGELVIANSMVLRDAELSSASNASLMKNIAHMSKIVRGLQEIATNMRMVPLEATFHRTARVARDTALRAGVLVDFTYEGSETELDRTVVEQISSPLVHMVRNAIDHGIEPPEERRRLGKPEKGKVCLSAWHESGNVVIRVEDDGKGLDKTTILARAKELGLVRSETDLSERDIYNFIFEPGFSTATRITDISGRGVGMDVVKQAVEKLRGRIDVRSEKGRGTTFTMRLPLTMAIIDGMVIRVGNQRFIVPTLAIQEALRPQVGQLHRVMQRGEMISVREQLIPLVRLYNVFGIAGAKENPCEALILVTSDGDKKCAILVDDLIGQQQVVVKPLGDVFRRLDLISGATIMGDGLVALILDVAGIVRLVAG